MSGQIGNSAVIGFFLVYLLPLSLFGQDTVTFSRTYDFSLGYESGTSILKLDDGYLIGSSGYATEVDGWWGVKLLRTNLEGDVVWKKVYGRLNHSSTSGWYGAMQQVNGGYVLAAGLLDSGNVDGKGIIYRFNELGDTLWTRVYDKPGYSFFSSIRQTADSGFILIGNQNVSGIRHYWLMKADSSGISEWDTVLGPGYARTLEVTPDGGYIIGGAGGNNLTTSRIVKTDSLGNIQWEKTHFGGNPYGCYWAAGLASDGGYYIWGCWDTVVHHGDFYLTAVVAKLDSAGNRQWANFYTNPNNMLIAVYQVKEIDGYLMIGGEKADQNVPAAGGWIVKAGLQGNTIWEKIHTYTQDSSVTYGANTVYDFNACNDGGYIFTGVGYNDIDPGPLFNNNQDIWLLKLDSLGNWYPPISTDGGTPDMLNWNAKVYPNPTTGTLHIETPTSTGHITLYNLLGGETLAQALTNTHTTLDVSALPPGVYLYKIEVEGKLQTGKILVE